MSISKDVLSVVKTVRITKSRQQKPIKELCEHVLMLHIWLFSELSVTICKMIAEICSVFGFIDAEGKMLSLIVLTKDLKIQYKEITYASIADMLVSW